MEGPSTNKTDNSKPDPFVGKVIDKYVLLERLGKGGMGLVYKAQHKRIKRFAALKLLPASDARDEISIKRLEREATAMGNLQHPGIATMYDFGITPEGQPYIVLELMRGQNLKTLLKEAGRLAPDYAINLFIQIAEAMEYAHEHGIMHRDLKPENLMFTEEGNRGPLKVLDFGIARHTEESLMLTKTGQIVGSAAYMSPEQCSGKKPVDYRTDVYALGVIMYEMLTGNLPHKGKTFLETIYLKTTEHPSPFPSHLSSIEGLEALVNSCLFVEPDDRPQSMEILKNALLAIQEKIQSGSTNFPPISQVQTSSQGAAQLAQANTQADDKSDELDQTVVTAQTEVESLTATNVINDKKKVGLAVALVAAVSLATVAALNFFSSSKDTKPALKESRLAAPVAGPTKIDHERLAPAGTGIGADVLMGAPTAKEKSKTEQAEKQNPVKSTARSHHYQNKVKRASTTPTSKQSPGQVQQAPSSATSTGTKLPPVAPPIQRTSTGKSNIKVREPKYYKKQYDKARRAGRNIDKKIRQFIRKF